VSGSLSSGHPARHVPRRAHATDRASPLPGWWPCARA